MKKYFLLINVIVGFGCTSTVEKKAAIPSELMVELLTDIHILEARVDKLRLPSDSAHMIFNTLQQEIFDKYGVDKSSYEESYQYYLSEPAVFDGIYNVVVDSLNVIQKRGYQEDSELQEINDPEVSKDSTKVNSTTRSLVEKPIQEK
ncbi:MAG: DUF4296 domain-containing protein [Reichenbachiella sp.]|uniref:DUF4296 domain-containing protein n=1 Tax=Reichenbachiella sp. TaxID=2184521 RepID=UPI0032633258